MESLVAARSPVDDVLKRFANSCPALRDLQVAVEVRAREGGMLVMLPAQGALRGCVDLVFTRRGGLRTCSYPRHLTPPQRAAVEELAWALREALVRKPEAAPRAATPP